MAVIRSRKAANGRPSPSGGSLAYRGDRLLRRRPKQRTSCLGMVTVFLALVVLAVVATVQATLKNPRGNVGSIRRNRNAQHLQQQQQQHDSSRQDQRHLHEHLNTGARYSSDSQDEREAEPVQPVESNAAPVDSIDEPRDTANEESLEDATEDPEVIETELEASQEEEPVASEDTKEFLEEQEKQLVPSKPDISFCDFMRKRSVSNDGELGYSNPAVVVLGMEDTSADLVWQVVQQILYPNHKSHRAHQLTKHATAIDYGALGKPKLGYQNGFWSKVSTKSHGKWIPHVFCQQQEHDLPTGFTWLSSPDFISKNEKAQDTLRVVKDALPSGSVKILRIRRNYLDVLIRHAQVLSTNSQDDKVALDQNLILGKLGKLKKEQDAVDKFLWENDIPHLELDFESLFPFDHWTDMVQVAQTTQKSPVNLIDSQRDNNNMILGGSSLLSSQMESAWREVLQFVGLTQPTSMFDILQKAMRTHKVHSFWIQKDAVLDYSRLERMFLGTKFYSTLRRQELHLQDWGEGDEM